MRYVYSARRIRLQLVAFCVQCLKNSPSSRCSLCAVPEEFAFGSLLSVCSARRTRLQLVGFCVQCLKNSPSARCFLCTVPEELAFISLLSVCSARRTRLQSLLSVCSARRTRLRLVAFCVQCPKNLPSARCFLCAVPEELAFSSLVSVCTARRTCLQLVAFCVQSLTNTRTTLTPGSRTCSPVARRRRPPGTTPDTSSPSPIWTRAARTRVTYLTRVTSRTPPAIPA